MLPLFAQEAEIIKKKPQLLSKSTHRLLLSAAKAHHPHNQLLPAGDIQQLINIYSQTSLTATNADAAQQLLAANCLSLLLKVNFHQLGENKLYLAVVLYYGQIIEQLLQEMRREGNQSFVVSKMVARGIVLTKIISKMLWRTHAFVPEYYRFVRTAVDVLKEMIKQMENMDCQGENGIPEGQAREHLVIRMCFSKKVTKQYLAYLLGCILEQIRLQKGQCPTSKHIDITANIINEINNIKEGLPQQLQDIIVPPEKQQEKQQENDHVYLDEPIKVKQLTPRMYDEQKTMVINKLRKKKQKLTKKIEGDLRKSVQLKQQQSQAIEEVRRQRSHRQHKKQLFVIQKQTAEAKQYHKKQQKVKNIKKTMKSKTTQKQKLDKLSRRKKKK